LPDETVGGDFCPAAGLQYKTKQITTTMRMSGVSSLSTTPMVPTDLKPVVLLSSESIITLLDSGALGAKMTEIPALFAQREYPYFLGKN
jgi:hypothetical protein